ncbi:MAG: multiheme c-type cytochrome [Planctomycetota bacterium]|jgi:hypothetical protein
MKFYLLVFVLAAAGVLGAGCGQGEKAAEPNTSNEPVAELTDATTEQKTEEEPLLLLDDEEPLLLLDDDEGAEEPNGPQADNSRCFVCHINYMDEDVAVVHARANIGCAGCHGESDEHIADESWASGGNGTAPDTMFPRPNIVPFCMSCHPKDKIDTVQHEPLFADMDKMVCTDCHGKHRITTARKCKWK